MIDGLKQKFDLKNERGKHANCGAVKGLTKKKIN